MLFTDWYHCLGGRESMSVDEGIDDIWLMMTMMMMMMMTTIRITIEWVGLGCVDWITMMSFTLYMICTSSHEWTHDTHK